MDPMITVYLPQDSRGEDGKFYKTWEVPQGLPLGQEVIYIAPPENLLFPRWDALQGIWVEDKDSIIESLKETVGTQEQQITDTQLALAEVFEIMLGGEVE